MAHDYTELMIKTQVLIKEVMLKRLQEVNKKILDNGGYRSRHERVYHDAAKLALLRNNQNELDESLTDLEFLLIKQVHSLQAILQP